MENNYCGICKHIQYRLYTCPNWDITMCEYCSNYINNEKYCEDCYFKNMVIGKCFQCEQKSSLFINIQLLLFSIILLYKLNIYAFINKVIS